MGLFKEGEALTLIMGIGQRPMQQEPKMATTVNDALEMQKVLAGYARLHERDIVCLVNEQASSDSIIGNLKNLQEKTKHQTAKLVIIYFSGHGCYSNGELYFVCNNTTNEISSSNSIPGTLFIDLVSKIYCQQMLVLLDCCHAGSLNAPVHIPFNAQQFLESKPNRVILNACHRSQTAFLSSPLSLFTFALAEGISGKDLGMGDKVVTVFDLAMYVRERVCALSTNLQKPQFDIINSSTTLNFPLVAYPNGQPPPYFSGEFKLMDGNNKAICLDLKPVRDEAYRRQFIQFAKTIHNIQHIGTATFKK